MVVMAEADDGGKRCGIEVIFIVGPVVALAHDDVEGFFAVFGRIFVLLEETFDENLHLGAGAFLVVPDDGAVLVEHIGELLGRTPQHSGRHAARRPLSIFCPRIRWMSCLVLVSLP